MPRDDGFGFDDYQGRSPPTPQSREPDPQESVSGTQTQFVGTTRALKDENLTPESQDLCLESGPSSKALPNRRKQRENDREHVVGKL